jgi:hypothetical protein
LQDANNTAAARTIVAHPLNDKPPVKTQIPKESSDPGLADVKAQKNVADANDIAIRMPVWDTASSLPAEFAPKITPTQDRSFSAMTTAQKTLSRPKPEFSNPETNAQGEVADKYWPHPVHW